ncbi:MAG: hypothetical protein ACQEXJ_19290 [Myxococcota bacterium]
MRIRILLTTLMLAMAMALGACDSDGDGTLSPGDFQDNGRCSQDNAAQPCDGDCAFDPASIDCQVACQHVADVCASGECNAQCDAQNQDVQSCISGCEGAKSFNCGNVTFGCWASSDTCQGVSSCFLNNM